MSLHTRPSQYAFLYKKKGMVQYIFDDRVPIVSFSFLQYISFVRNCSIYFCLLNENDITNKLEFYFIILKYIDYIRLVQSVVYNYRAPIQFVPEYKSNTKQNYKEVMHSKANVHQKIDIAAFQSIHLVRYLYLILVLSRKRTNTKFIISWEEYAVQKIWKLVILHKMII